MSCVSVSSFFVARTLSSKCVDSCSIGFLCVGETAFAATLPRRGEGAACEATELAAGDEVKEALAASVLHGGGGGRVAVPGVSVVHVFKMSLLIPIKIQYGIKILFFQSHRTNYVKNDKISKREVHMEADNLPIWFCFNSFMISNCI